MTHSIPGSPDRQDRLILAKLPLTEGQPAQVHAGNDIHHSRHGDTQAYLFGLPYFTDPWLNTANVASRWAQDRDRVLETVDGTYLLLVVEPGNFYLVNDKVSPLTWYWTRRDDAVHASNSLTHLTQSLSLPIDFDYESYRHMLHTRNHHFDRSLLKGVSKLLKGHLLSRQCVATRYYDFPPRIKAGSTPGDYFDHIRDYTRQTLAGKKVALLASNGYDSRLNAVILSQCLDRFDIFTFKSDVYSEHSGARQFFSKLPRQNYNLRTPGYSMAPGSPHYAPRWLGRHPGLFLDCFDDLSENKEHLLFLEVFAQLAREGFDAVVTGCMGGDVRRVHPLYLVAHRDSDLDLAGTPQTKRLFGISDKQIDDHYRQMEADPESLENQRELFGDGQMNYTAPLLINRGICQVALPLCTARSMEIYRGIDRAKLPGRGGINFFREFIAQEVPGSKPVPFDTGIALHVPFEKDSWLADTVDIDTAHRTMLESGLFDPDFLKLMRDTYGQQRQPYYSGACSYLNLWAWFAVITNQPDRFAQSLSPLTQHDPYLQPKGVRRGFQIFWQRLVYAFCLLPYRAGGWRDHRHPINRFCLWSKTKVKRGVYLAGSAAYGVLRKCLGLPPWDQLRR